MHNPPKILADLIARFCRLFERAISFPLFSRYYSERVTALSPRDVNATGRLRFLDPVAGRAREKSVAFPWPRPGPAGRYRILQDGRPTRRALLHARSDTREPPVRSGRGASYRYMHGHC